MLLMRTEHIPVLSTELVSLLDPRPGEVAIDRDPEAQECFEEMAGELPCRTRFIAAPFAEALRELRDEGLAADMAWFDFGVSSMQIDTPERGFSYSSEAPLDMRMDPRRGQPASEVVAEWDERRLARAFREFGEERYANQIARAIVRERERRPIETTTELVDVVSDAIPAPARFGGGHPAKRVFQALRIAVNDELEEIDEALPLAWERLRENGRFAGISFHSLEDRRVKRFLAGLARECVCPPGLPVCRCGHVAEARLLTRGAVRPTADEVAENPRSASARLRAAQRVDGAFAA